jgi:hypothetical protein
VLGYKALATKACGALIAPTIFTACPSIAQADTVSETEYLSPGDSLPAYIS